MFRTCRDASWLGVGRTVAQPLAALCRHSQAGDARQPLIHRETYHWLCPALDYSSSSKRSSGKQAFALLCSYVLVTWHGYQTWLSLLVSMFAVPPVVASSAAASCFCVMQQMQSLRQRPSVVLCALAGTSSDRVIVSNVCAVGVAVGRTTTERQIMCTTPQERESARRQCLPVRLLVLLTA